MVEIIFKGCYEKDGALRHPQPEISALSDWILSHGNSPGYSILWNWLFLSHISYLCHCSRTARDSSFNGSKKNQGQGKLHTQKSVWASFRSSRVSFFEIGNLGLRTKWVGALLHSKNYSARRISLISLSFSQFFSSSCEHFQKSNGLEPREIKRTDMKSRGDRLSPALIFVLIQ